MQAILEKFPEFNLAWQEHLEWWEGENRPGLCTDMSAFSGYVLTLLENKANSEYLRSIFLFIEQLMVEGDDDVQTAAATCFLENIINSTGWEKIPASTFVEFLGEESKKYCKAWDEFTGVKTEGLW